VRLRRRRIPGILLPGIPLLGIPLPGILLPGIPLPGILLLGIPLPGIPLHFQQYLQLRLTLQPQVQQRLQVWLTTISQPDQ
jgi:hypothetical protein